MQAEEGGRLAATLEHEKAELGQQLEVAEALSRQLEADNGALCDYVQEMQDQERARQAATQQQLEAALAAEREAAERKAAEREALLRVRILSCHTVQAARWTCGLRYC